MFLTCSPLLFPCRWGEHTWPLKTSKTFLSPCFFSNITPLLLYCLWHISPSLPSISLPHSSFPPMISEHPFTSLFCLLFVSFLSLSLSVSLPCVVSVAGVLLFLTATALTSMTFFSCLVRHQTPALGEATLLHRRRATAKLCTGTARQWSRTVSRRKWGEEEEVVEDKGGKEEKCREEEKGEDARQEKKQ